MPREGDYWRPPFPIGLDDEFVLPSRQRTALTLNSGEEASAAYDATPAHMAFGKAFAAGLASLWMVLAMCKARSFGMMNSKVSPGSAPPR